MHPLVILWGIPALASATSAVVLGVTVLFCWITTRPKRRHKRES